jgi:uncharacterized protein
METSSMREQIFAVPLLDQWLVYAPLHRLSALVNHAALQKLRTGDESAPLDAFFDMIRQEQEPDPPGRKGKFDPDFLGLITTRACNCSCVYCGFGGPDASRASMPGDLAVASVDWMAEHARSMGKDVLDVHFFGGEPTVAWDAVEIAVHRARTLAGRTGLIPRFEIATNGFLDEGKREFIGDYFDTVVLSFDGPKPIHDRNRPANRENGSFEAVRDTALGLGRSGAELCFRMCVTMESVGRLESIVTWFCDSFRPSVVNFETLQPNPASIAAGLHPPDPYEFAARYHEAGRILRANGVRPHYAADISESPRLSFCPVGTDSLMVRPDGGVSGCYLLEREYESRGLDMNLGRVEVEGGMRVDWDSVVRLRRMAEEKPRCRRCFCRWTCAGGCHVNHSYPGGPERYDDFCVQTRIISACSLLDDLDQEDLAENLLADRAASRRLAMQNSDCLNG